MTTEQSGHSRFMYVPGVDGEPFDARTDEVVVAAEAVAAQTGLPLLGVAATKHQLPDGWGTLPYRTRKSHANAVSRPAVEVHFCATLEDLAAMPPDDEAPAFIMEFNSGELSGWAHHHRALHFDTRQELHTTRSADALELYEAILWNGNNGWHDAPGKRDALRDLRKLKAMGELELTDLLGYMIGRQGARSIQQLRSLARHV